MRSELAGAAWKEGWGLRASFPSGAPQHFEARLRSMFMRKTRRALGHLTAPLVLHISAHKGGLIQVTASWVVRTSRASSRAGASRHAIAY